MIRNPPVDIMLEARGMRKHFGGVPALDGADLRIAAGKVTALIGPNGAGKTTMINCLTGVIRPDVGRVLFRGMDLTGIPAHRAAAMGISRTFQNVRIFPRMSVLDNVLCGLTPRAGKSVLEALARPPGLRHRERLLGLTARAALDLFGIADKAGRAAGNLSYGDKKRVEMARAFVSEPHLVFLDEPVAGLNHEETAVIGDLIRRLRTMGRTMVLVEHDMNLVMNVSDRVTVLDGGRMIAEGTPDEVRHNPIVLEAYLGRASVTA